jgi:tRNA pseudouridine38-40 synthase
MPPRGAARKPAARATRASTPQDRDPTARWRLVVAYDGSAFKGFAAQPNQLTVAGTLAEAIARTVRLKKAPQITCAGRTDAGVHARGQVVHVDLPATLPTIRRNGSSRTMGGEDLLTALNRQVGPAVVVQEAAPAPEGFDARRSATGRRYRYLVWNGPVGDPLLAPIAWHVSAPLGLRPMSAASDVLVGEHDFAAFCRRPPGAAREEQLVRRVRRAAWSEAIDAEAGDPGARPRRGRLLRFDIEADSFCHQMVRSLVAVLVEVGKGGPTSADMVSWLRSGERAGLPAPAPAHGLCLVSVTYGG